MSPLPRPDWIDPAAWDIAQAYGERMREGDDAAAIDEALELVADIRAIRELPEPEAPA